MSDDDLPVAAEVTAVEDVTPRMRRVRLAGPEVTAYLEGDCVPNIKLYFPGPDGTLDLPTRGGRRYVWGPGQRERVRTYTVRHADPATATIEIDFVRHGDEGLASAWVERVRPGDRLGLLGGGGLVVGECDWLLVVADETGLPAATGILRDAAPGTRGVALLEVADAAEEQLLEHPAGIEVRWHHRDGAPAGTTTWLQDRARELDLPEGARVWVAAESVVVRTLRDHLREVGFDRRRQLIIGYWHRGMTELDYGRDSDHDRVRGELEVEGPPLVHAP